VMPIYSSLPKFTINSPIRRMEWKENTSHMVTPPKHSFHPWKQSFAKCYTYGPTMPSGHSSPLHLPPGCLWPIQLETCPIVHGVKGYLLGATLLIYRSLCLYVIVFRIYKKLVQMGPTAFA
jgi:hypothetical protein